MTCALSRRFPTLINRPNNTAVPKPLATAPHPSGNRRPPKASLVRELVDHVPDRNAHDPQDEGSKEQEGEQLHGATPTQRGSKVDEDDASIRPANFAGAGYAEGLGGAVRAGRPGPGGRREHQWGASPSVPHTGKGVLAEQWGEAAN